MLKGNGCKIPFTKPTFICKSINSVHSNRKSDYMFVFKLALGSPLTVYIIDLGKQ